jgi:hypothetical protein
MFPKNGARWLTPESLIPLALLFAFVAISLAAYLRYYVLH